MHQRHEKVGGVGHKENKMKKIVLVMIVALFVSVTASAQFTGGSSKGSIITVQKFKNECSLDSSGEEGILGGLIDAAKCDDRNFVMEGNIVAEIDDNIYEFKDKTGSIHVEVDDFRGVKVGPEDLVRLFGEADYDEGGLILEVERLELVK